MRISPPPFRDPMQQQNGSLTRSWEQWFTEVQRLLAAMPGIQTFAGDPNGAVLGVPGDLVGDTTGGANTTLYVKESGANTSAGWVAK